MGLGATVMCNCFRLGLTTEPPVPRDWLHVDEEGYFNLKPGHDSDGAFDEVDGWMKVCCEHPDLEYASEHIANWSGYRIFQQALAEAGWDNFPVLRSELPNTNDGQTKAPEAALALRELAAFRSLGRIGSTPCLVDSTTGEVVVEHVRAYGGVFIWCGNTGLEAGFDGDGFFIRTGEDKLELFRAARFRQKILDPRVDRYGPEPWRAVYVDLDLGREFECRFAVPGDTISWPDGRMQDDRGRYRFDYPAVLHVEDRSVHSSDYEYILGPPERVFQTSIETGNPVQWC